MFADILLALGVIIAPTPTYLVEPVVSYEAPVANVLGTEEQVSWVEEELFQADMEPSPNTTIAFTNAYNCGAELSPLSMGGCMFTLEDGAYFITLSPGLEGTVSGRHTLFHEIGHTLGLDECGAEYYAQQFDTVDDLWAYPECRR